MCTNESDKIHARNTNNYMFAFGSFYTNCFDIIEARYQELYIMHNMMYFT